MEIQNVDKEMMEPIGYGEVDEKNEGLMRVLENKQKQIELMKERITNMEKNNDKLDRKGDYDSIEKIDFEFDLGGN